MAGSRQPDLKSSLSFLSAVSGGVSLRVFLAPRSSSSRIIGEHGDSLKIAVSAPPVEGAANEALIKLLSKQLKIPRSRLEIVSGEQSRHKVILIADATVAGVESRLMTR